jgi:serine/threonine protein phosphatase PrpC
MREVIAERITVTLKKGDFLVMVSDGVVQTGSKGLDLSGIVKEGHCRSAHALASRVLEEARTRAECSDDMSVCAMRFY